ncbi:MAG: hypothetical protein NT069_13080, partial [Planctomycetota bacterium]|nr:hypothetical protein [Planctomycetota bacterium]
WNVSGEVSKNTIGIPGPSVLSPDGRRRAVVSVVSGNQVILPLIDANENSATQVASDKTQTSPAKLSTRWPQGCSLAPIAFSPEGQSLAVRVQRRPEIGDHLKGLATGNRPDQLLIAETWVVDVESGTPSAVIPGQSTSQSLYVAPERLLLFELESQATVVPGISPVLWTTAPHRSIVKSVFVVLSGVVPVAWRWRRKRHAGN